jgi:hypothetical protein
MGKKHNRIWPSQKLPSSSREQRPSPMHEPVSLSFRHISPGRNYCLSECSPDNVRHCMDCFRQMTTMSKIDLFNSGGKNQHQAGLGFKKYDDNCLEKVQRPQSLSLEIPIYAVRATQKFRVFGGFSEGVFSVLWFDPNHEIVKS